MSRSQLKPVVEVAQMLKRHLNNLLIWLEPRIPNAVPEGLNPKIQSLKSAARGFNPDKSQISWREPWRETRSAGF